MLTSKLALDIITANIMNRLTYSQTLEFALEYKHEYCSFFVEPACSKARHSCYYFARVYVRACVHACMHACMRAYVRPDLSGS